MISAVQTFPLSYVVHGRRLQSLPPTHVSPVSRWPRCTAGEPCGHWNIGIGSLPLRSGQEQRQKADEHVAPLLLQSFTWNLYEFVLTA